MYEIFYQILVHLHVLIVIIPHMDLNLMPRKSMRSNRLYFLYYEPKNFKIDRNLRFYHFEKRKFLYSSFRPTSRLLCTLKQVKPFQINNRSLLPAYVASFLDNEIHGMPTK